MFIVLYISSCQYKIQSPVTDTDPEAIHLPPVLQPNTNRFSLKLPSLEIDHLPAIYPYDSSNNPGIRLGINIGIFNRICLLRADEMNFIPVMVNRNLFAKVRPERT